MLSKRETSITEPAFLMLQEVKATKEVVHLTHCLLLCLRELFSISKNNWEDLSLVCGQQ